MIDQAMQISRRGLKCGCCGISAGEEHHKSCLINLPACTAKNIITWQRGCNDGEQNLLPKNLADDTYVMGYNFGKAKLESERAVKSLLEAAELAKRATDRTNRRVPRYT